MDVIMKKKGKCSELSTLTKDSWLAMRPIYWRMSVCISCNVVLRKNKVDQECEI